LASAHTIYLVSVLLLVCPWSSSRACRSNLTHTSLTSRFLPFNKNHIDSVAVITPSLLSLASFLSREHFNQLSPSSPLFPSYLLPLTSVMKFAFEIKTEPVTQATIIVPIVAFSSGSLALIAIYSQSPLVSPFCIVVLAVVVYLALRLASP
jgi:hypothetical protein